MKFEEKGFSPSKCIEVTLGFKIYTKTVKNLTYDEYLQNDLYKKTVNQVVSYLRWSKHLDENIL